METYKTTNLLSLISRLPLKVYLCTSIGIYKVEKTYFVNVLRNIKDDTTEIRASVDLASMAVHIDG